MPSPADHHEPRAADSGRPVQEVPSEDETQRMGTLCGLPVMPGWCRKSGRIPFRSAYRVRPANCSPKRAPPSLLTAAPLSVLAVRRTITLSARHRNINA